MSKHEADYIKSISTKFLKDNGYFKGKRSGVIVWKNKFNESSDSVGIEVSILDDDKYLRIYYNQTDIYSGEKEYFDYKIPLTTTSCRFGGKRYWFICPWYRDGVYCGKRVGTLYKDGDYFACRHCHNLTYNSRNTNRRYKAFPLFEVLMLRKKIDELLNEIKRPYYAGKPTKKQKQLEKFCEIVIEKSKILKDIN